MELKRSRGRPGKSEKKAMEMELDDDDEDEYGDEENWAINIKLYILHKNKYHKLIILK